MTRRCINLEAIWGELEKEQSIRAIDLARRFHIGTEHLLVVMEHNGYLLSEDEKGMVRPYRKVAEEDYGKDITG